MTDLLAAVGRAQSNIDRLAVPEEFRSAVELVMEFARQCGAHSLLAASPVAERLVGALMVESDWFAMMPAQAEADVLIIDVNLASGTAVANAARVARHAGARQVHAAVLFQLTEEAAGAADCGVDDLAILCGGPAD